jgi:hypothetical protein
MNTDARALLEKLLRTRPRPDERALTELFMAIKSTPIQDLLAMVRRDRPEGEGAAAVAGSSSTPATELEAEVKRRLRKVGGKAQDFLPYLFDTMRKKLPGAPGPTPGNGMTLGKALAACIQALGEDAQQVVDSALESYVAENDVSYRLKSA